MDTLVAATRLGGRAGGPARRAGVLVKAGPSPTCFSWTAIHWPTLPSPRSRGALRMIMKDGELLPRVPGASTRGRARRYRAVAAAGLRNTATISTPRNQPAKSRSSEKSPVSVAEAARSAARLIPVGLFLGNDGVVDAARAR